MVRDPLLQDSHYISAEILYRGAPLVFVQSLPDSQSPGSFVSHSVNRRQKTQSVALCGFPKFAANSFHSEAVQAQPLDCH